MHIDGACHCGRIAYRAEVDPAAALICHCSDCQVLSGSAFRTALPVPQASFELLRGEPRTYLKTADSGAVRAQVFCPDCGTHLYATSVDDGPKVLNLRTGTARQRAALVPRKQCWHDSAQSWVGELARLPTSAGQPD